MKKLLIFLSILILSATQTFAASNDEALKFFYSYVNAANTYSTTLERMYSPNALIIRQVIKHNGQLVNVSANTSTYIKQLKLSQNIAKARNYKNKYTNITVSKVSKGYKISANRHPSGDNDSLKMYQIVREQPNGKWLIVEELMQTRQQIFLNHANK